MRHVGLVDVVKRVASTLEAHPAVRAVRLVGSRQRGTAGGLSDWDFEVEVVDFRAFAADLPALVSSLHPLAQQWDRLSRRATYMLILPGPVKVDLLFDQEQEPEPPWRISAETLHAVDRHFWDWILWIAGKQCAGRYELAEREFIKMSAHLLRPLGVQEVPDSVETAITLYRWARQGLEDRLGVAVWQDLEQEIRRALRQSGYHV